MGDGAAQPPRHGCIASNVRGGASEPAADVSHGRVLRLRLLASGGRPTYRATRGLHRGDQTVQVGRGEA
eukprot:3477902-Pyramimonas_sp.AAC.1